MKPMVLIVGAFALSGCVTAGVDSIYSDKSRAVAGGGGFPELAAELGALKSDCVLERADWEAAFIARNITSSRRVSNALNGLNNNGQAIYFQDRGVLAIAAEFCKS